MEYTTLIKASGNLTLLDKAMMTPMKSKEKIELTLKSDGELRVVTTKLQERNPIRINHSTLPDDSKKTHKTVLENGGLKLYDKDNLLIRTVHGTSIKDPIFAEQLSLFFQDFDSLNLNNIFDCIRSHVNVDSIDSFIANPPSGTIVNHIDSTYVTLRMQMPDTEGNTTDNDIVLIIDKRNRILLGSRIYDSNNKNLQCMIYNYDECTLKGFKQEVVTRLPSGIEGLFVTLAEIENIEIINHIN